MENNNKLTTIAGFNDLQIIGLNLLVSGNDALVSLSGFGRLERANGALEIVDNEQLSSIDGFAALDMKANALDFRGNNLQCPTNATRALARPVRASSPGFASHSFSTCIVLVF